MSCFRAKQLADELLELQQHQTRPAGLHLGYKLMVLNNVTTILQSAIPLLYRHHHSQSHHHPCSGLLPAPPQRHPV